MTPKELAHGVDSVILIAVSIWLGYVYGIVIGASFFTAVAILRDIS